MSRLRRLLFGEPRNVEDPKTYHSISLIALLAWVGLGADGLSSSAYGPDEAFRALGPHTYLAVALAAATAFTVFVMAYAYSRIIEHFPYGGGGYVVATKLLGRSAGAQLAMVAAYELGAPPSSPVIPIRAVVSYYGPVDLADGYRNPPRPDPLDVRSIEAAFLGGTPDQVADRYREASPIIYVSGQLPPSLLIYGGRDHVVLPRFGAMLEARLRAAGATSVLLAMKFPMLGAARRPPIT